MTKIANFIKEDIPRFGFILCCVAAMIITIAVSV